MTQFSQQDLFGGPRPLGVSDPRGSPPVSALTTPQAQSEEEASGTSAPPDRRLCQPREPDTWHRALTRRLRTLVRIAPLHRVEATKGLRDEDLSAQDLRALGLRAVDSIIEEMGLGGRATRADEERLLAGLILAAEPDASPERVQLVTKVVLDALLNERERRQAFREQYTDYDQETPTKRVLAFHLLREQEQEDGSDPLPPSLLIEGDASLRLAEEAALSSDVVVCRVPPVPASRGVGNQLGKCFGNGRGLRGCSGIAHFGIDELCKRACSHCHHWEPPRPRQSKTTYLLI